MFIRTSATAAHAVIWLLIEALMIFRNHAKLAHLLFVSNSKSAQTCNVHSNVGMVTIFPIEVQAC